jgi:hypothetical protein
MDTAADALTTVVNAQNQQKVRQLTDMANGTTEPGTGTAKSLAPTTAAAPTGTVNTGAATLNTGAALTNPAASVGAANTTQNRVNAINDMYAAQNAANMAQLQSGYDISRSDLQAAADSIAPTYQQQANANAVDWERQRRNFLEGANMSGVNTGAGSQAELHMMGAQQRGMNTLRAAQAGAEAEAARQMANLTAQYQAQIAKAAADADYQKAAALLDEYQKGYERDLANAQVLAEYGDFSGFAGLFGEEAAQNMLSAWAQQNPELAYVSGQITQDQYQNIIHGHPINEGLDENGNSLTGGRRYGNGDPRYWLYQPSYYNGPGDGERDNGNGQDTYHGPGGVFNGTGGAVPGLLGYDPNRGGVGVSFRG